MTGDQRMMTCLVVGGALAGETFDLSRHYWGKPVFLPSPILRDDGSRWDRLGNIEIEPVQYVHRHADLMGNRTYDEYGIHMLVHHELTRPTLLLALNAAILQAVVAGPMAAFRDTAAAAGLRPHPLPSGGEDATTGPTTACSGSLPSGRSLPQPVQ